MERLTPEQIQEAFRALCLETAEARQRFEQLAELAHLSESPKVKEPPQTLTSSTTQKEDTYA